ncbi:Probable carboxyvinyl-carboxyphosphonate phosphorylmutase [hydrothermal vent metagenome]|uniref:Probable carboxyvinyl-carboxyphosphonate phosphorylmutase n=1 Tax=hydrothermal vent metagenome TaxID=652676 RepID=A0A3B0V4P3_9ZZZZ
MSGKSQQEKAQTLLSLHTNGRLLLLPNIWNPIGARILQAKGYTAVATASAAISAALGYEDGEKIKLSTLLDILRRIANSVDVPVTADIEAGFADSIPELKETIQQVIASGVVGINIEDSLEDGSLRSVAEECERITAVRETSNSQGVHLLINARVDSFLSGEAQSKEEKIEDAIMRAGAYVEAGADCIYPIGPGDKETVIRLRQHISAPINILASPSATPLKTLQDIGINRVSFGPFVFRSCLSKFVDIVDALHDLGSYDCFAQGMMSGPDTNRFLNHEPER